MARELLTRAMLAQVRQLLRPLEIRIANLAARGVVKFVDDSKKMQLLQLGALQNETIDGGSGGGAEHVQPYGFSSVPLVDADTAVIIFPFGDRQHPLVVAVGDRRFRPTGGQPGEVTVYNNTDAFVRITKDGDILARAAPGRRVLVDDGSGTPEELVKRSEFLNHGHPVIATGATTPTTGPVSIAPAGAGSSSTFPGTSALKST